MKILTRDIRRLKGVDLGLSLVFYETQKRCQHEIHVGYMGGSRTPEQQNVLFKKKRSTKDGYIKKSKHQPRNGNPSRALDFVIYSGGNVVWDINIYECVWFTFLEVAAEFGIDMRWGGDWNRNGIRVDKDPKERFVDCGHVELIRL